MPGVGLGLDCKLYRNTASHDTPTWVLVGDVRNLTQTLEKAEADITTRANGGWRAIADTLKDGTVEFELLKNNDRDASVEDYEAFRDAWLGNTPIECLVLDGANNVAGSEGLQAIFAVTKFTRTEELENAVVFAVTMRPTLGEAAPDWYGI